MTAAGEPTNFLESQPPDPAEGGEPRVRQTDGPGSTPGDGTISAPAAGSTTAAEASVGFWTQVWRDTFRNGGARVGLAWIGVLVFASIFAPLLANSEPYIVDVGGHWSSPMIRNLTPTDVSLLVISAGAVVAFFMRRYSIPTRWLALTALAGVTIPMALLLVHPPQTTNWEQYRDLARDGKIKFRVMAPIPFSPNDYERDDPDAPLTAPTFHHLLGTDTNGGDVLSRMIHASRIALSIGIISTGISLVIGIVIGGLMGYFAGTVDIIGMRLIEIFEFIPTLFLLIVFVAFYGRNLTIMMVIIGLTGWTGDARFLRAEFLRLRNQDFVQAAIASGLPLHSILFRHLLPNGLSPLLVNTSFGVASAILFESILSFLGLGLVDEPSWGQMLNQARGFGDSFVWWIMVYPGAAIFLTVFAYTLLGEALRDALDPKLRR
jgi:peptide/nickel transport system permease protein